MNVLFAIYLIATFLLFFLSLEKNREIIALKKIALFGFMIIFAAAIGFRNVNAGIDTQSVYRPVYESIRDWADIFSAPITVASYDSQLYWAFLGTASLAGFSLSAFYVLHCLLLFLLMTVLGEVSKIDTPMLAIFYCSTLLFLMSSSNTLRQGVAVIIFLIFCNLVFSRRWKSALCCGVALVLCHGSGVLVAPLALLPLIRSSKPVSGARRILRIASYTVVVVLGVVVYNSGVLDFLSLAFQSKVDFYIESANSFSNKPPLQRPWVLLSLALGVIFIVAPPLSRKLRNFLYSSFPNYKYFRDVYILLISFWVALSSAPGIFERFGDYVAGLQIFIFAALISGSKRSMFFLKLVGVLACVLLAFFNYTSNDVRIFFE